MTTSIKAEGVGSTIATEGSRRRRRGLPDRWPTAVAVVMSLSGFLDPPSPTQAHDLTASLGGVFVLLPLGYLVLAKLRNRAATWPVVITGLALVVLTRTMDLIDPVVVLSAIAVIVLAWGLVDGQLKKDRTLQAQALACGAFAAVTSVALLTLTQRPDLAGYLVASAWLLHGIWDLVHLKLDKVVSRSFAEWCAVLDILIAIQLVWLIAN